MPKSKTKKLSKSTPTGEKSTKIKHLPKGAEVKWRHIKANQGGWKS